MANLLPDEAALEVSREVLAALSYFAVGARYPDELIDYTRPLAEDLWHKALEVEAAVSSILAI